MSQNNILSSNGLRQLFFIKNFVRISRLVALFYKAHKQCMFAYGFSSNTTVLKAGTRKVPAFFFSLMVSLAKSRQYCTY